MLVVRTPVATSVQRLCSHSGKAVRIAVRPTRPGGRCPSGVADERTVPDTPTCPGILSGRGDAVLGTHTQAVCRCPARPRSAPCHLAASASPQSGWWLGPATSRAEHRPSAFTGDIRPASRAIFDTLRLVWTTSVLNQKGGVGKTGLASGTAGALAERGRRVLVTDLDPQGHCTTEALGLDEVELGAPNIADALTNKWQGPIEDLITTHSTYPSGGRIDIIPTSLAMYLVVRELYLLRNQERRLEALLAQLPDDAYDHVIVDCAPSLDVLTDNALVASDGVIIPVQPAKTSVRALRLLLDQVNVLEDELKLPRRRLLGLVPSVYRRPMTGLARYVMGQLEDFAHVGPEEDGLPVLAHLPLSTTVEEAWLEGTPTTVYAPNTDQAAGYRRIAVRLDVAAGLSEASEWEALPPLPSLAPAA